MERTPVESSNLRSVGYDPASQVLEIEFTSGAVYRYYDVPVIAHQGLLQADSKGQFLNIAIKGHFRYARVDKPARKDT